MNARATLPGDHRESADHYRGELFRNGSYRVAVCRDGIQWMFQHRRPGKAGVGGAWDALGFCRCRETLERLWREKAGHAAPASLALLPKRFPKPAAISGNGN